MNLGYVTSTVCSSINDIITTVSVSKPSSELARSHFIDRNRLIESATHSVDATLKLGTRP